MILQNNPNNVLNFYQVDDRVSRSGQPMSLDEFLWLRDVQHVGRIVKLNEDEGFEGAPDDECLSIGIQLYKNPISVAQQSITEPDLPSLLDTIDYILSSAIPVLVHCWHGQDRTGLVVALYRIATGWTIDAAWSEALQHDYHRMLFGLDKAFYDLAKIFLEQYQKRKAALENPPALG